MDRPKSEWPEEGICIGEYYPKDEMDEYLKQQAEQIAELKKIESMIHEQAEMVAWYKNWNDKISTEVLRLENENKLLKEFLADKFMLGEYLAAQPQKGNSDEVENNPVK